LTAISGTSDDFQVLNSSFLANGVDLFAPIDVGSYQSWFLELDGAFSLTLNVQFAETISGTYSTALAYSITSSAGLTFAMNSAIGYCGCIFGKFMRIRCTAFTSNTSLAAYLHLKTLPFSYPVSFAAQAGTWTTQIGNTPNTTAVLFNQSNNNAVVAPAAGSVTVIKASAGNLVTVTITTAGTVATNIFDNASAASGTVLLALPATTTLGQTFNINGRALLGITAAGSGAGAPGYTVYFS